MIESSRREFCARVCQLASLASGAAMLGACSKSPTSPGSGSVLPVLNATVTAGVASLAIDVASPLATTGGMALVQSSAGSFLVARTGDSSFTALTSVCTHEGCTVSEFSGSIYVCPCHGSEFSTSGSVVNGPANRPLATHATTFANGVLAITT